MRQKLRSAVGGIIAAAAWYALALQLSMLLRHSTHWAGTLFNFFGYFTILTNTLVAVTLTAPTVPLAGTARFASASLRTATAVYISIVGFVYIAVLQELWTPRGAQALADLILHKVVPMFYVAYWLFFEPHGRVRWRDALPWLLYPVAYLTYTLMRGAAMNWYPYPFLDVATIGYRRTLVNAVALLVVFLVMSALAIGIDKAVARRPRVSPLET